jgi:hypothetical protein
LNGHEILLIRIDGPTTGGGLTPKNVRDVREVREVPWGSVCLDHPPKPLL